MSPRPDAIEMAHRVYVLDPRKPSVREVATLCDVPPGLLVKVAAARDWCAEREQEALRARSGWDEARVVERAVFCLDPSGTDERFALERLIHHAAQRLAGLRPDGGRA